MMAVTATRLAGFVGCFLFGALGAAAYWLSGHHDKAIPHAIVWLGAAWLMQPNADESDKFYKWLDARLKAEGLGGFKA